MNEYYFRENVKVDNYAYIFLCGTSYHKKQSSNDKRDVLSSFLQEEDGDNRPIILEKYFAPSRTPGRMISYQDVGFDNLYQVEMLVNYLSAVNFIFLESISTAAEAGMFLGLPRAQSKTCLIIPDEMAVEENKLGEFLRLSFEKNMTNVKLLTFYPQIVLNNVSQNVSSWHTFFWKDQIGDNLGSEIRTFVKDNRISSALGNVKYNFKGDKLLTVQMDPDLLSVCVGAVFSIEEYKKILVAETGHTMIEIESLILNWLKAIFINTAAEQFGKKATSCSVDVSINIDNVGTKMIIGMILYLMHAAELIAIKKMDDYAETGKIRINTKMVNGSDGKKIFFYDRFKDCINPVPEKKIVI